MNVAVLRETADGERRVALVPDAVSRLIKAGNRVMIQEGAGQPAMIDDDEYRRVGAEVVVDPRGLVSSADVLFQVRAPRVENDLPLANVRPGTIIVALFQPLTERIDYFQALADKGLTVFSLDSIPRISRAQSMDVLSSMSTVAGYRAVAIAAERLGKFFPMLMTAAGTIPPARVLVLGAGVAGLQAIATAHRLGATVQAFDTRPVVREQVESLGASFLTLEVQSEQTRDGYAASLTEDLHQRELDALKGPVAGADVVITTAQIPGQKAPILITGDMVASMKKGSVIVDLASEAGGNCEWSQPGQTIVTHSVTISAPLNVPSQLPLHASQLFARNATTFFQHAASQGLSFSETNHATKMDLSDEIVQRTCLIYNGEIVSEVLKQRLPAERS